MKVSKGQRVAVLSVCEDCYTWPENHMRTVCTVCAGSGWDMACYTWGRVKYVDVGDVERQEQSIAVIVFEGNGDEDQVLLESVRSEDWVAARLLTQ